MSFLIIIQILFAVIIKGDECTVNYTALFYNNNNNNLSSVKIYKILSNQIYYSSESSKQLKSRKLLNNNNNNKNNNKIVLNQYDKPNNQNSAWYKFPINLNTPPYSFITNFSYQFTNRCVKMCPVKQKIKCVEKKNLSLINCLPCARNYYNYTTTSNYARYNSNHILYHYNSSSNVGNECHILNTYYLNNTNNVNNISYNNKYVIYSNNESTLESTFYQHPLILKIYKKKHKHNRNNIDHYKNYINNNKNNDNNDIIHYRDIILINMPSNKNDKMFLYAKNHLKNQTYYFRIVNPNNINDVAIVSRYSIISLQAVFYYNDKNNNAVLTDLYDLNDKNNNIYKFKLKSLNKNQLKCQQCEKKNKFSTNINFVSYCSNPGSIWMSFRI